MPIRRLSADTARSIRLSFGAPGVRALEFLDSAADLMDGDLSLARQSEMVAYCLREAFMSILNTQRQRSTSDQWNELAKAVAAAVRSVERSRGLGTDAEEAASGTLLEVATRIETFQEQLNTHQKRLIAVLAQRTGSEPGRWADQTIRDYVKIIRRSNAGVHGEAAEKKVRALWHESLRVLEVLFTPAEVRQPRIDQLAALTAPTDPDLAELLTLTIVPNHFRRFLARLTSTAWVPLLETAGLLDLPVDQSAWDGHEIVDSLSPVDPPEVAHLLRRIWERSDRSLRSANTLAWSLQNSGLIEIRGLSLELCRQHPQTVELATLRVDQLDPIDEFVVELASVAFVPDVLQSNTYLEPLTTAFMSGITEINWEARVGAIVDLLVAYNDDEHWGYFRDRGGSISDPVETYDSAGEQLAFLLGEAISRALLVADSDRMNSLIDRLPTETQSRARVFYLVHQPNLEQPRARSEISRGIQSRFPNRDDSELIERVTLTRDPLFQTEVRNAFGPAPSVGDVARRLHDDDIPQAWRYRFAWSPFLEPESIAAWRPAIDVLSGRYGEPTAVIAKRVRFEFTDSESPIDAAELAAMSVEKAIDSIRAWRPQGRGRGSAMEISDAAASVFLAAPQTWFADPIRVVSGLRHPTYISRYLRSLTDWIAPDSTLPPDLTAVVELVWAEPWPAAPIGGEDGWDQDTSWKQAQQAGLELLKKTADLNLEFADFETAWHLVEAASFVSPGPDEIGGGSSDSLTRAINRPGPRAFRAAMSLLAYEFRKNRSIVAEHQAILDRALTVPGPLAVEYRSIIAIESRLMRGIVPTWLDSNFDELFVRSEYAQDAIDIAMKFGSADSDLLRRSASLIRNSVTRNVDRSLDRMIIGMLWGVRGYGVAHTEKFLAAEGRLSEAGAILGRLLSKAEALTPAQLKRVLQFWESAASGERQQSLAGFAWLARASSIPDDAWIRLTRLSVSEWSGSVNGLHFVAERLERLPATEEVLDLMGDLVLIQGATWDRGRVVSVAVKTVKDHPELSSLVSFQRLDHFLRERGLIQ